MNIQEVIDRLKSECPLLKSRVAGAADYDLALEQNTFLTPCAYVVELSNKADSNQVMNGVAQTITVQIGVMVIISNQRDGTGKAAHDDLQPTRLEIMTALCGWKPSAADIPIEYLAGRSEGSFDLNRFWADVFTTDYLFLN
ncbi:MAG: hypothetical protein WCL34_06210 [Methylococcaceae bacterium]